MILINIVCNNKVNPIANGWFIWININLVMNDNIYIIWIISRGSLYKILILGINEKIIIFLLKF